MIAPAPPRAAIEPGAPTAPDAGAALAFDGVSKSFRRGRSTVTALRGMNFRVPPQTVTGLVGPDGAGKTTIIRLAAGLLGVDGGAVTVFGADPRKGSDAVRASIGYMPQRFGLYEDLTVNENLQLYGDLQGVPSNQRADRYERLMTMTGLAPFLDRRAGRLSGGMKQKLGLACTLVRSPRLLLLDEPTAGVDPVSRRDLWDIIQRIMRDENVSVLLSTAYIDEAERCDQVVVAHEGVALATGAPQELTSDVAGRTLAVRLTTGSRRTAQRQLSAISGVVDVSTLADSLHVVTNREAASLMTTIGDRLPGARVAPATPRLEDAVVSMLTSEDRAAETDGADGSAQSESPASDAKLPTPASDEPVIVVEKATRKFGSFVAVNEISFEVRRGEVFGLLGANGAGKTTTFRMLCGLLPATSGRLRVAGIDLRSASAAARARIGYVSQHFALYGELSVFQNLRFFASAYGLRGKRRAQRIAWALDEFDLASVRSAVSGSLPLGFGRRLAMACALMHDPDVLFLDEPTSGVDPLTRRRFWRRITAMADRGMTVLVTTHHVEEAEYCDHLVLMVAGRLAQSGTPEEVRASASTPETPSPTMDEAFLSIVKASQGRKADGP